MKRGFKDIRTEESFKNTEVISSIDKSVEDLMKNNSEIESILKALSSKKLTDKQKGNIADIVNDSLKLSDNVKGYMEK